MDPFYRQKPEQRLGDAPLEKREYEQLAHAIDAILNGDQKGSNRATGFVLLLFPFGDRSGRCNFLSNGADRRDVVILMKEMIARFEGQPEIKGEA